MGGPAGGGLPGPGTQPCPPAQAAKAARRSIRPVPPVDPTVPVIQIRGPVTNAPGMVDVLRGIRRRLVHKMSDPPVRFNAQIDEIVSWRVATDDRWPSSMAGDPTEKRLGQRLARWRYERKRPSWPQERTVCSTGNSPDGTTVGATVAGRESGAERRGTRRQRA